MIAHLRLRSLWFAIGLSAIGVAVWTRAGLAHGPYSLFHQASELGGSWTVYPAFAAAAAVALGAALPAALRPAAAGALLGLGGAAYISLLPWTVESIHQYGFRDAIYWQMTIAAALVATGGLLLHARAERSAGRVRHRQIGLPLGAAQVAALAAVGYAATVLHPAIYEWSWWTRLEPVWVGAAAAALVAGTRRLDRATGSCALIAFGGFLLFALDRTAEFTTAPWWIKVEMVSLAIIALAGLASVIPVRRRRVSEPPVQERMPDDDVARQLCVAGQNDRVFAEAVVTRLVEPRRRAIAPSWGSPSGDVMRHCVAATGRRAVRNVLVGLLLLPAVAFFLALVTGSMSHAIESADYYSDAEPYEPDLVIFVPFVALALAASLAERWTARIRIPRDPETAIAYLSPGAEAAIREFEAAESPNVVVYSGYRPWVGAGVQESDWALAIDVTKGAPDIVGRRTARGFTVAELHDHVAVRLRGTALPGLEIRDRLYVDGERLRDNALLRPDASARPRVALPVDDWSAARALASPEAVRHVRSAHVTGWNGEITFSLFYELRLDGVNLCVSATYCALKPPRQDPTAEPGWRATFGERAAVVLESVAGLLDGVKPPGPRAWRRVLAQQRARERADRLEHGAATSVRELAQVDGYHRYFQWADHDRASRVLERELLDALLEFLEDRDIDTSDLIDRQTAMLNNGVIVTGGQLSSQSMAVGAEAKSTAVTA